MHGNTHTFPEAAECLLYMWFLTISPTYYLSTFFFFFFLLAPMSFCKVAEKLIKDFLWEGSDNSGVTHIKEKGGLGIDSIMTTKTALFSKWIWRCLTEKNSLRKC